MHQYKVNDLCHGVQVVGSPLAVSHPPSLAYQVAFLKQLMAKVTTVDCTDSICTSASYYI